MKINEEKFILALNNGETFKTIHYETNLQRIGFTKNYSQKLNYKLDDNDFLVRNREKLLKLGVLEDEMV